MVAYKGGEQVYEDCWNGYRMDDCSHVMSVTKSIFALLIGIAIDKGQIKSVDDKVLDYFPEYKVKRGEQIGTVGSSGMSSGMHLHYEVILNGKKVDPVYYFFNDLTPAEYEEVLEQARQENQSMS